MKKFVPLLISCSMVLAGAAMAQQPQQQASPEKKEKKSQVAEAKPGTQTNAAKPETTPKQHGQKHERALVTTNETGAKPETGTGGHGKTNVKNRTQDVTKTKAGTSSSSSTSRTTTVNKTEFKSRHTEVFRLGRHPKAFFIERFGQRHFRLIGQTYFVFVDGCWVAVDVDGFVFLERIICPGDPDFIVVVD